jgi:ubiquinone/menaquinone biosynthesis C-methylase UbiE
MKGYVGIDFRKSKAADVVTRASILPYNDNEVDEIFSSHLLEHIEDQELKSTFQEWYRVLKPGGKLVIRVPDFEMYCRLFLQRDWGWKSTWGLRYIFGYQRRKGDVHYSGWWKERFEKVLPEYGFKVLEIKNIDSRQKKGPQHIKGADLWVEAIKV